VDEPFGGCLERFRPFPRRRVGLVVQDAVPGVVGGVVEGVSPVLSRIGRFDVRNGAVTSRLEPIVANEFRLQVLDRRRLLGVTVGPVVLEQVVDQVRNALVPRPLDRVAHFVVPEPSPDFPEESTLPPWPFT
jgi:hypothetical protein